MRHYLAHDDTALRHRRSEMTTTVLVAGSTGNLGSKIVYNLLRRGANVRALVREGNSDGGEALRDFTDISALSLAEGDLADPESLIQHLAGVDVIVSAVQGGPEVIIDGQTNLLRAAEEAGVQRMIPSDFSVDLHRLDYGDNLFLDMRKTFDEQFDASPVRPTYLLNGGFMDIVLASFFGLLDLTADTLSYWGDDQQPMDFTTIADAAAYTAAVALDPTAAGRTVAVAGDVLTMTQLRTEIERATNHVLTAQRLGDIAALDAEIERRRPIAEDPFEYVSLQYQRAMVTGKGKLHDLKNGDYPDITPTTVAEFLATTKM
jgi:uncharacterized protein YbjT (DUF2867 family)